FQPDTCSRVRRAASFSGKPCLRNPSYDSSRCAASSAWTSSLSAESSARPESRRCTSLFQSGMGHLGQLLEGAEELRPLALQRRQLLLSRGRQAITASAAAVRAGFPCAPNPPLLLHSVEHRIERREGETQRTTGLLFDAARQLVAVQRAVLKDAEDRQFRRTALDSGSDHWLVPLHIGFLYI